METPFTDTANIPSQVSEIIRINSIDWHFQRLLKETVVSNLSSSFVIPENTPLNTSVLHNR